MQRVFISSVMRDFGEERAAIESLDLKPLMAELAPASPDPSRTALLPLVAQADVVVLILGARYGFRTASDLSPTEEEFNAANADGRPVLTFVQEDVEREEPQEAFKARVGGGWEEGAFHGSFSTPQELERGVVRALRALMEQSENREAAPAAEARAEELASGAGRSGRPSGGSDALRLALVPVAAGTLIDALVLNEPGLVDRVADVVRRQRLVPQQAGLDVQARSSGIQVTATTAVDFHTPSVQLAADGAVLAELGVRAEGDSGFMAISLPRAQQAIASGLAAAHELWELMPAGHTVRQVAVCIGLPGAESHPLSLSGVTGSSIRTPVFSAGPILAPRPALLVRRAEVTADRTAHALGVALKQAFADRDALVD